MFVQRVSFAALGLVVVYCSLPAHALSHFPQKGHSPSSCRGTARRLIGVAARAVDPILRGHGIKVVIENVVSATGVIGL